MTEAQFYTVWLVSIGLYSFVAAVVYLGLFSQSVKQRVSLYKARRIAVFWLPVFLWLVYRFWSGVVGKAVKRGR